MLTCEVYPYGSGHLTWRHEGYRVKYDKLVAKLELENPSGGEYECYGNLTLDGFKYFTSRAYATGRSGFLYLIDVCFFDLTYGASRCNGTQRKNSPAEFSAVQIHYNSQGGRGNFTYLLEGQIHFALKLSIGCLISQF